MTRPAEKITSLNITQNFPSIINLDVYFFGLIYETAFKNKALDETQIDTLKNRQDNTIREFKENENHKKSPHALKYMRECIETYPLCEYLMQSTFLRMTGAQEQKMKCICWELATNDYEYRYERFRKNPVGECSSYKEKTIVYKDLIGQIQKFDENFDVGTLLNKSRILQETRSDIINIFTDTNISMWAYNSFTEFTNDRTWLKKEHFGSKANLFESSLQNHYQKMYHHRNRCAHNALSYQQNIPTLRTLSVDDYKYDNYFIRFALLILIDKRFIALYAKYLEGSEVRI